MKIKKKIVLIIISIKNLFKIFLFQQENHKGLYKGIQAKKIKIKYLLAGFQEMKA